MSANKHTPWRVREHKATEYGNPDLCSFAIERSDGLQIATVVSDCIEDHEDIARLIAAAPELLEALERIARPHDCGCKPCTSTCRNQIALEIAVEEMQELARAAIAKAGGGE